VWALTAWRVLPAIQSPDLSALEAPLVFCYMSGLDVAITQIILYWLLVALAVLDAEHLWLPNWITFPGIGLGLLLTSGHFALGEWLPEPPPTSLPKILISSLTGALVATAVPAALILLIRWTYWLIRRREGIGLGDAKLMAMLGAWLGLSGALLSFAIGVTIGAVFALNALVVPAARRESDTWLAAKLPLGTFLCIGGIIAALWGQPIITAYLRWAGF
jgi:leader peptidase (prepilin peptidase) / N-methyltransferase